MTSTITIRIDNELKSNAMELFSDLGMDMTTACTIFLKKAVAENGIPFPVSKTHPNKETMKAIEDAANKKDLQGPFKTMKELEESLNA